MSSHFADSEKSIFKRFEVVRIVERLEQNQIMGSKHYP